MKECAACKLKMKEMRSKTPDGVPYTYFQCPKCNEEILDMKQLHAVADKYRTMKRYQVKVSKWGKSLGLRIPKELAKKYNFENDDEVTVIPEKNGIRIISI